MKTQLPKFEGEMPAIATVKVSGSSDERIGALARNEEVYFVVKGICTNIDHGDAGGVLARIHKVKAVVMILIEPDQGARMLSEAVMLADDRFGIQGLFEQGDQT